MSISLGGSGIVGISYGETSLLKNNLLRAKERRDSAASNVNSAKMKLQVNGSSGRIKVEADNLQSYYSSIKNNNAKIDKVIRDIDYIVRRFKEVDSRCANRIKSIGRGYKVRSGISKIGNSLISFGNKVINGIGNFFRDGINAIKSMGTSVKNWFSNYSFFGTSRLGNLNGVGYLGARIPGVDLGCGLPAVSFNRDGINAIKSMGTSVKNWFSNYSFFGTSRLGNLNGVGYLGARIPGVGLGCGLPAVSFNRDGITYAGTSIYNKIKSFISSIGDKYNKWVENRHINAEKAVIDLRDKNKIEWLDYTDEENIYTWEEVKKYIEGGIWGSGLYFGNEISDLPKQIIYKKGIYTYVSILEEDIEYFNGMPLNIGDPITLKDGTVIDHRLYKYKIVDTDEPPISAGIVSIPGSLKVPKVNNIEGLRGEISAFEKGISKMSPNDRVATVKIKAKEIGEQYELIKDNKLSKINGRDIYKDSKTGNLYAVDSQHGRFEVLNRNGKHLGEVNFNFEQTKPADNSGKHNIKIK